MFVGGSGQPFVRKAPAEKGPTALAHTATSASGTWRSPHSPRSWRTASMQKLAPWRRPTLHAPPSVLTGSVPPRRVWPSATNGAGLARAAEAERLEPLEGDDGEPVVELGAVDVGRREVGPRPQLVGAVDRRVVHHVVEHLEVQVADRESADASTSTDRLLEVAGPLVGGEDHRRAESTG